MKFAISYLPIGLALTTPLYAQPCPAGKISYLDWCEKYRLDRQPGKLRAVYRSSNCNPIPIMVCHRDARQPCGRTTDDFGLAD